MWEYTVLKKIRGRLLFATNLCINATSKLDLPSVARLKFYPHYKRRVKLIYI